MRRRFPSRSRLLAVLLSAAALASASPEERTLLEQTGARFLGYRNRCRDTQCIAEAYLEIGRAHV